MDWRQKEREVGQDLGLVRSLVSRNFEYGLRKIRSFGNQTFEIETPNFILSNGLRMTCFFFQYRLYEKCPLS